MSGVDIDTTSDLASVSASSLYGVVDQTCRTALCGLETVVPVGCRTFHTNDDHDNVAWEVTQHGPITGTSIRF
jgi:hypothetical protein